MKILIVPMISKKKISNIKISLPKDTIPSKIYVDYLQNTLNGSFQKLDHKTNQFTKGYYNDFNSTIHTVSAFALFLILGILAFFVFPLKIVNSHRICYKISGILIFGSILLLLLNHLLNKRPYPSNIVLYSEVIMLFSFGFSWLLKAKDDYSLYLLEQTESKS